MRHTQPIACLVTDDTGQGKRACSQAFATVLRQHTSVFFGTFSKKPTTA